jgi:hypothetical protein
VRHRDADRGVARRLHRELLEPGQRPAGGADPLPRSDPAVGHLEDRLDRERRPDECGRGPDTTTTPEVLQGVDVEQGRGRRGLPASRLGDLGAACTGVPGLGSRHHREAGADADLPRVDGVHRHRRPAAGELGGLEGAAEVAGQVHGHDLGRPLGSQPLVGVEHHLGVGP